MKATDFAKILKEIIKKEVRAVIREELNEALNKAPQSHKAPTSAKEMFLSKPTPQPSQPMKSFKSTGNVSLDSILAETANAVRNGTSAMIEDDQSFPSMGEMFTADQAQGFGHMMQSQEQSMMPAMNANDPTAAFPQGPDTCPAEIHPGFQGESAPYCGFCGKHPRHGAGSHRRRTSPGDNQPQPPTIAARRRPANPGS